jgi:hypothetical protein
MVLYKHHPIIIYDLIRARICKRLSSPRIYSKEYSLAESIPRNVAWRNRRLGSLKVYKFGLRSVSAYTEKLRVGEDQAMVVIKQGFGKEKSGKSDFLFIFDDDFGFFLLCNLSKRNTPLAIRPHLSPYM